MAQELAQRTLEFAAPPPAGGDLEGPAEAAGEGGKQGRRRVTATEMAKQQREISVSEFFTKNRHLLGFDNPRKALLTCIKEAVDNSLDACEEAGILPEVKVTVKEVRKEERYRVIVEDNGPGIVPRQVPKVFGKLLYGSKFHRLKMSRGQQGIGISAAAMYGQLTTGQPTVIISKIGHGKPAVRCELMIDTKKNEPRVINEGECDWNGAHGTRVEIELEARYQRGRQSVDAYLEQTAITNPHVRMLYTPPDGDPHEFPRATSELPAEPKTIKPHPQGIELGMLMTMLESTKARNVRAFLTHEFSRVSGRVADNILAAAKIEPNARPSRIARQEAETLYKAIQATRIMNPPTDCVVPIGEELLLKGVKKELEADFYAAVSRPPSVYRGNPFIIEAAVAYGGKVPDEGPVRVYRFANRVPLLYQQSACAITRAISSISWRPYGLSQPSGSLPLGPAIVVVHMASVWVPFTSESKEAIAHYPEIIKEIKLALQACGRKMSLHIKRRRREAEAERKRSYIEKYIPHIGIGLREILALSQREEEGIVEKLTEMLHKSRK
ncbi:MAG TPA: DNA topoisomerase VI subunit B [Planctomycetota bacterium]|nr:DNA topoisomerase VI subunit B [Planctomycetota bacterium]HRR82835.1 DNA topoisomerase VI subunit B [Planctomycetota bacterium]HRT96735.1 DNA topoisomerase VI subunit B [Planctomycetota bacterium]